HAEAREVFLLVGDVEVTGVAESSKAVGRPLADDLEHGLDVAVGDDRRLFEWAERAVTPKDRRDADLQVDVAGAELDGAPEQEIEFHTDTRASACPSGVFRRRARGS